MNLETEQRIADLESQIARLSIRHSALEWIVEQHFAHYLLDVTDPEGFLQGISEHSPAPWRKTEEGGAQTPRPDDVAELYATIRHIADKVRTRVRQGIQRP